MAIDRLNERVAYLYQPLSPAILRMLQRVISAADEAGVEVSVCGKMAGDPVYALLLLGFGGVRELSMDPHSIPRMKKILRSVRMEDARKMASQVGEMGSTKEVHDFVLQTVKSILGQDLTSDLFEDDI